MSDLQNPLKPPKKILERLTPVKKRPTSTNPERRSPVYRKKRTLSSGDVFDRVACLKADSELEILKKKEEVQLRLKKAQKNRENVLRERKEQARKIINDQRIWEKYKLKASRETSLPKEDSNIMSVPGHNISSREDDPIIQQVEINRILDDPIQEAKRLISESVVLYLSIKRIKKNKRLFQLYIPTISEDESELDDSQFIKSIENLKTNLLLSPSINNDLLHVLNHYNVPTPFISKKYALVRVLLYSHLLLADSHISSRNERMTDTRLGNNALLIYKGYELENFQELHYYDDEFYDFLFFKITRTSRKTLIAFKNLLFGGIGGEKCNINSLYHLKFLKEWNNHVNILLIFNNFLLNRSLLLLLRFYDVCDSGVALHEQTNIPPDYKLRRNIQGKIRVLKNQIATNVKGNENHENDWFLRGLDFKERVIILYEEYKTMSRIPESPQVMTNILIPPEFTLIEWKRYRFERHLELYGKKNLIMKSGKQGDFFLDNQKNKLDEEMKEIGMKNFKECISFIYKEDLSPYIVNQNCLLLLSRMKNLLELQAQYQLPFYLVSTARENDIQRKQIEGVINVFGSIGEKYNDDRLRTALYRWRSLMHHLIKQWITHSTMLCKSYQEFELRVFKYELAKDGLSLEDHNEVLEFLIPRRGDICYKVLVLEYIFFNSFPGSLNFTEATRSLKILETIKFRLDPLFEIFKNSKRHKRSGDLVNPSHLIDPTIGFLWCISESQMVRNSIKKLMITKENDGESLTDKLDDIKKTFDIHFEVYEPIYSIVYG